MTKKLLIYLTDHLFKQLLLTLKVVVNKSFGYTCLLRYLTYARGVITLMSDELEG